MMIIVANLGCARTLSLNDSPCPCASGYQCCKAVCLPITAVCDNGSPTCAPPGDPTAACADGGVCAADFPCLTRISQSSSGECCASDTCATSQRQTVDVPQRTAPIIIDGSETDWTAAERHPMLRSPLTPESPDDLSANFAVAWDATAIYLLFEVRDDVFVPADSGPDYPYWDDGVEIFLDIDPTNPATGHHAGFAHYFVTSTQVLYEDLGESPRGWIATIDLEHLDSLQRWYIEMSLTWPPGYTPSSGAVLGFDVAVNDDDTLGTPTGDDREGQLFWNDGSGTAATDPHLLGVARIIGCPASVSANSP